MVEAPNLNWIGLIPSRDGSPPGVWSWDTLAQRPNEAWHAYCERTLRESLECVDRINVEDEAAEAVVPKLWFNVTSVSSNDV